MLPLARNRYKRNLGTSTKRLAARYAIRFAAALGLHVFLSACSPETSKTDHALVKDEETIVLYQSCLICHSDKELQRGPSINGLPAWYIKHQLDKFASGVRGRKEENKSEYLMGSTHNQYVDTEARNALAQFIADSPPRSFRPVVKGDPRRGKQLYAMCSACHGEHAEGNQKLMAPPLNLQEDWYLLDQLRKFASNQRGYHPDDYTGIGMSVISNQIQNDQDLRHLVAFLQTLSKTAERP